MFGWSPLAIIVLIIAVFLIFGAGKLPDIGKGFGKALKNFKNSLSGKDEIDVTPKSEESAPKKRQITKTKSATATKRKKTVRSRSTKKT